ncbi:MAG: HAD family hydrolase [Caulobacteraceae bacterium]
MTPPRPIKAVIFDMDGLILDTEAIFRDVMMEASEARGVTLPEEVFLRMIGLPDHASRAVAMDHFGDGFDVDGWTAHAWKLADLRIDAGVPVKAGVPELLGFLDQAGLRRAICTSTRHETVERYLDPIGLLARFDAVIAAGDYARGKPYPDPFLTAATRLGVDPADCLALEDSHNGVRAASAAGMMTVMVPDLLPATDEMRGLCLAVHVDLHEVAELISRSDHFFRNGSAARPFRRGATHGRRKK